MARSPGRGCEYRSRLLASWCREKEGSIRSGSCPTSSVLTALGSVLPERLLRASSRYKDGHSLDRYVKPGPEATRNAVVKVLPGGKTED